MYGGVVLNVNILKKKRNNNAYWITNELEVI